jgi:hypothetical protein
MQGDIRLNRVPGISALRPATGGRGVIIAFVNRTRALSSHSHTHPGIQDLRRTLFERIGRSGQPYNPIQLPDVRLAAHRLRGPGILLWIHINRLRLFQVYAVLDWVR